MSTQTGEGKKTKEKKTTDAISVNQDDVQDQGLKTISREKLVSDTYIIFKKYHDGTRKFRENCKENEEYWKTNHWHNKRVKAGDPKPTTPTLFSMVDNMYSDIMDQYPEPQILPVEPGDEELSEEMSALVNSVLERRKFKKIYRTTTLKALKRGAQVWQIIWDTDLYGGKGDVGINEIDIRNCLWEPGVENIQDGECFFTCEFHKKSFFKERFPEQYAKMTGDGWNNGAYGAGRDSDPDMSRYNQEDPSSDESKEVIMIDRWYKKWDPEKKKNRLHMVSVAGNQILYWSEEVAEEDIRTNGIYRDGMYPFIVMPLYPLDDTPIGLSVIDIFKDNQDYIDKLDQIVLKNALMAGKLRLLKSKSCTIPIEKLSDWGEETLEGDNIGQDDIRWFQAASLPPLVQQHLMMKIDMMKEESGQNQFNRGEGGKGVTAASAIMALQEAGSKRSRNLISHFYDYFSEMVWLITSRIVQFYDTKRAVRIRPNRYPDLYKRITDTDEGNGGGAEQKNSRYAFLEYDNTKINNRDEIEFDIKIRAQKQSPYQSAYINELAIQLKGAGVLTEVELLDMMDFEGKDRIRSIVEKRMDDGKNHLIDSQRRLIDQLKQKLAVLEQTKTEHSQQTG